MERGIRKVTGCGLRALGYRQPSVNWAAIGIVCGLQLAACGLRMFIIPAQAQGKIVAVVNNEAISQQDLEDFTNFTRVQLSSEYQGPQLEKQIAQMRTDLLEKLIEDRLILQEAKKSGIVIDENRVKGKIDQFKKRYGSAAVFAQVMKEQGITQADLETRIREQLYQYAIVESNIRSKITVAPKEVTQFYQEHSEEFSEPQTRDFESIKIADQEAARVIAQEARSGVSFKDLAEKHGLALNTLIGVRPGQLKPDIEAELFSLGINGITSPIPNDGAYYIFALTAISQPRQRTLQEAQDQVYAALFNFKMQARLSEWIEELKKKSYIKIMQ